VERKGNARPPGRPSPGNILDSETEKRDLVYVSGGVVFGDGVACGFCNKLPEGIWSTKVTLVYRLSLLTSNHKPPGGCSRGERMPR